MRNSGTALPQFVEPARGRAVLCRRGNAIVGRRASRAPSRPGSRIRDDFGEGGTAAAISLAAWAPVRMAFALIAATACAWNSASRTSLMIGCAKVPTSCGSPKKQRGPRYLPHGCGFDATQEFSEPQALADRQTPAFGEARKDEGRAAVGPDELILCWRFRSTGRGLLGRRVRDRAAPRHASRLCP